MKNLITSATVFLAAFSFSQTEELVSFQYQADSHVVAFEAVAYSPSSKSCFHHGKVESIVGNAINLKLSLDVNYQFVINHTQVVELTGNEIAQYAQRMEDLKMAESLQIPGLVFSVQVGAFESTRPNEIIAQYDDIKTEQIEGSGLVRYMIGNYSTGEEVLEFAESMRAAGFKDAFPVAYLNGKRISFTEANNPETAALK